MRETLPLFIIFNFSMRETSQSVRRGLSYRDDVSTKNYTFEKNSKNEERSKRV